MKKIEFKSRIDELLQTDIEGLSWNGKLAILKQRIVEAENQRDFDKAKKGEPWTDEEPRLVLRTAPTIQNCMLLARTFRRGYGSIEQIFRWAAERSTIDKKRPNDACDVASSLVEKDQHLFEKVISKGRSDPTDNCQNTSQH